jgi:GT2 family glycosyltransferase
MNFQISIIIVSFNTSLLLKNCLKSIFSDFEKPKSEIIVIDNNSEDNTLMMLRDNYPSVKVVENNYNAGFAKANNQGLQIATGKYVFLLNPDTFLLPNAIKHLHNFIENTPSCGACGPRTWLDKAKTLEVCPLKLLTPQRATALFTSLPGKTKTSVLEEIWRHDSNAWVASSPFPVEGIGGAAVMIRKSLLNALGGLDETFFMGYEDTDLCATLKQMGKTVYVVPNAEVIHLFGQAKKHPDAPRKNIYSWNAAPLKYMKKHFGSYSKYKLISTKYFDSVRRFLIKDHRVAPCAPVLQNSISIEWDPSNTNVYIFELSNESIFYDKFGKVLYEPRITISDDILSRLDHSTWFWRVWTCPANTSLLPLKSGVFMYKNKIA